MKKQDVSDSNKRLKTEAQEAPKLPGVYLWKDETGQIIYVGKAKSLRDRLCSYFSGGKDLKTAALLCNARNLESIITRNEYEALLLENTLIKQHSPKYNISLKDCKTYPVVRLTTEEFPRVFRTRRIIDDKSQYYGPFPNLKNIDALLDIIDKLLPLRKCRVFKKRTGPCMYYHIGSCKAPCCGKIKPEEYRLHVVQVQRLLTGNSESIIADLGKKMHQAAKELQFESAALIRNAIRAIEDINEGDRISVDFDPESRDYIVYAAEEVLATITVFSMRDGKMTGRELYRTRSAADEWESLEQFIITYYNPSRIPPAKIFLQTEIAGTANNNVKALGEEALLQWFARQFNFAPQIIRDCDKHHKAILAMAQQNAREDLRKRLKERGAGPALDELAAILQLENRPEHIEGFDISHLEGKYPVASLVSFKNGVPDKKNYRRFRLRSTIGVVDDFASIREAVQRRYSRLIREDIDMPDLVLIDGGIGQVNAAKTVMDALGIKCAVAGLAKRNEEIWLPNAKEPLVVSRRSEALKVLQFVRDETHRFATGLNQLLRSKALRLSSLESVKGIGKQRAAAIMKTYGSLENIAAAKPESLAQCCGIGITTARAVRAAARLELENRKAQKPQLKGSKRSSLASSLAAQAAEPAPEYTGSLSKL
ncbi:MAG: excinuclease ABC subunit UvrC [Treponema sp.]|nr:excinuclease ABC subunit UvrC [Treponema sp.]